MKAEKGVLLCLCDRAKLISEDVVNEQRAFLLKEQAEVLIVDDLCHIAAKEPKKLDSILSCKNLEVRACHERAAKWILDRSGADSANQNIQFTDLRSRKNSDTETPAICDCKLKKEEHVEFAYSKSDWSSWYPVIDYDRCTNCGQCYSFCLFGVYEMDDLTGEVKVVNPDHCKDNCPACARACPEVAIIFPKIKEAPINGADVTEESLRKARVQVDINEFTGSEAYQKYAREKANPRRGRLIQMLNQGKKECDCELGANLTEED